MYGLCFQWLNSHLVIFKHCLDHNSVIKPLATIPLGSSTDLISTPSQPSSHCSSYPPASGRYNLTASCLDCPTSLYLSALGLLWHHSLGHSGKAPAPTCAHLEVHGLSTMEHPWPSWEGSLWINAHLIRHSIPSEAQSTWLLRGSHGTEPQLPTAGTSLITQAYCWLSFLPCFSPSSLFPVPWD